MPFDQPPRGRWDRSVLDSERLAANFEESDRTLPTGEWQGRRIIGRDTPIDQGVYVGAGEREAIVVDGTKDIWLIHSRAEFFNELNDIATADAPIKDIILGRAFDFVKERMAGGQKVVDEIAAEVNIQPDQKIELGYYILRGGGVCRHRALFGAYLLECARKRDLISGRVSVDRNTIPGLGGHAWIRYTNSAGQVYIIDAAQNFIGTLEESIKGYRDLHWDYRRPEDYKE